MKKYIRLIPTMIFPYAYMIYGLIATATGSVFEALWSEKTAEDVMMGFSFLLILLYQILVIAGTLYSTAMITRKEYSAYDAAKTNLVVKAVQIPAYIFHFVLGFCGLLMSIWGIPFIFFAIIIDLLTIVFSGIYACGCMAKLQKENVLSKGKAIGAAIGSFVYCVDIVLAIVLVAKCKKESRNK